MQIGTFVRHSYFLCGMLVCPVLMAQQEGLPPMGGVGGDLRSIENRALAPNVTPKASDKPVIPPLVPQVPLEPATKADMDPPRIIGSIEITGDLAFADEMGIKAKLESALVDGQPKTRQEIQKPMRDIYNLFISNGCYLARITLPRNPYSEETKKLTVLVEAGLFGEIKINFPADREDGRWFSREQIATRFKNMEKGETFKYRTLYEKLSEINEHPDLTLNTTIRVRKEIEGTNEMRRVVRYADLDFDVKESLPLHVVFDVNNYGTESVGEWQAALTVQYLNLTKTDDVLTFSPAMSIDASLLSLAGSYMRPHDIWKGGATTLYGGWSQLDTEEIVPGVDLMGQGYFAGLVHSYKLIDDEDQLVSLSAGIVYRYFEDQIALLNTAMDPRDSTVLPLSVALSYSARKPDFLDGRNFATAQFIYNCFAGGSSSLQEWRTGTDDNYMIGRVQVARLQPVFGTRSPTEKQIHQWILFLKAEGQYASCPLIPAEQLGLGGYNTIRGYTTRGFSGDNGIYGTVEFRTPVLLDLVSKTFGRTSTRNPLDRIQFVTFMDAGYLETIDPLPGAEASEMLMSAGGGIRLAMTQYSQLRLDVGIPLLSVEREDSSSAAYYLNWQMQF